MKKYSLFFALFLMLGAALIINFDFSRSSVASDYNLDEQSATIMAIKNVKSAVVSITVIGKQAYEQYDPQTGLFYQDTSKGVLSSGTGFLISSDGLILTNKHVISDADNINNDFRVIMNSGKRYYAQLIGRDPLNDMAILKIFDKDLPYVELGNSEKLEIGTTVIAIGNALGRYQNTATKGIVSGLNRNLTAADASGNYSTLTNVIQTDAEINLGNSGGPLVDLYGRVVGINVAIDQSGTAIGFAIPINDAKPVVDSVKKTGRIIRSWLGIRYTMITPDIAEENKLKSEIGAWVNEGGDGEPAVVAESPAAKAGLANGDIILEVDGVKVTEQRPLYSILENYPPGKKAGLRILREDKIIVKIVELAEYSQS